MQDRIFVIIPAFNEAGSIAKVIADLPASVSEIIVVDNASTDQTAQKASQAGATVLSENRRGYGNACLKGMAYLKEKLSQNDEAIIVFLDGDYSDYPGELDNLARPIIDKGMDMVIGSRVLGRREKGSLQPQQRFGNWLATRLIFWFYGYRFTDLGPFRSIRWNRLLELQMADRNYGWTVEMQVKAARKKYRCTEVPVSYRKRIGHSKVSGTLKGTFMAGYKILFTIFKYS